VDGGVIDQNIQAAIAAVEVGGDLLGAGWVGDIQPPGQQMPVAGEGGGLLGLGELTGGEGDGVAAQGELPGELAGDAAVGPGDQHHAVHRTPTSGGALLVICGPLAPSGSRRADCAPVQHPDHSPAAAECSEDLVDHSTPPGATPAAQGRPVVAAGQPALSGGRGPRAGRWRVLDRLPAQRRVTLHNRVVILNTGQVGTLAVPGDVA
jgi:hypothetical protein